MVTVVFKLYVWPLIKSTVGSIFAVPANISASVTTWVPITFVPSYKVITSSFNISLGRITSAVGFVSSVIEPVDNSPVLSPISSIKVIVGTPISSRTSIVIVSSEVEPSNDVATTVILWDVDSS